MDRPDFSVMLGVLISVLVLGDGPDMARARQLYESARYENALRALGRNCSSAPDPTACEKLRAFIQIALGNERGARVSFQRILAEDPGASLGADVSPKIQALFDEQRTAIQQLKDMELSVLDVLSEEGGLMLRVPAPEDASLVGLTIFISAAADKGFRRISCAFDGEAWIGDVNLPLGAEQKLQYYLKAALPNQVTVWVGSRKAPRVLVTGSTTLLGGNGDVVSPDPTVEEGLPEWAWWGMAGGGAVLVAVGITLAVVLTRGDGTGDVSVTIELRD